MNVTWLCFMLTFNATNIMNDCWVKYYNTTLVVGERIYLDIISPVALWSYGDVQAELKTKVSQLRWKKHAYSVCVCVCVCMHVCLCVWHL